MIKVNSTLLNSLAEHFHSKENEIVCGAILGFNSGSDLILDSVINLENENYELRNSRYLISPAQYESAENSAAEKGLNLLGFYHSSGIIEPGEYDKKHALPEFVYLLFNCSGRHKVNFTLWKFNSDKDFFEFLDAEVFNEVFYNQAAVAV